MCLKYTTHLTQQEQKNVNRLVKIFMLVSHQNANTENILMICIVCMCCMYVSILYVCMYCMYVCIVCMCVCMYAVELLSTARCNFQNASPSKFKTA